MMHGRSPAWVSPGSTAAAALSAPKLLDDQVHVWRSWLCANSASRTSDRWRSILSVAEQARVEAIAHPAAQSQFVHSRTLLRRVLSAYVHQPPQALTIAVNSHGKPRLLGLGAGLHFNVAHTMGLTVVAVSRAAAVGIDTERRDRSIKSHNALIRKYLSEEEHRALGLACGNDHSAVRARLLQVWTCKEAVAKCMGLGVSAGDLRSVQVMLDGGQRRIASDDDGGDDEKHSKAKMWQLDTLDTSQHYTTLAVQWDKRLHVTTLDLPTTHSRLD